MNRPHSLIAVCSITLAFLAVACLLSLSSKAAPSSSNTTSLAPTKNYLASATATSAHREASNIGLLASPPNQPPVAGDDTLLVHGVTNLTQLLANDSDPDGNPISLGGFPTEPQHGAIFFGSYHPEFAYTGADSFSYEVCDNQGACDTGNVTVDVRNNTPNANDDSYQIHGTTTVGPLLQNDSDQDNDALTLTAFITDPEHGLLLNSNTPDVFSYVPASPFTGQDGFIYKVCDSLGACDTASVTLNITNGAPTPVSKKYPIRGNTIIGPLLLGDTDPEGDAIILNTLVTSPSHGELFNTAISDVFEYRPGSGFSGSDSFVYRECDTFGACANATVTLLVVGNGEDSGTDSCASVGEPINVTNGNMYLQQTDYSLSSMGPAVEIERTFNSNSERVGLFGRGWSTAYDESILSYDASLVRLNEADGRATYLARPVGVSGSFLPLEGDFHGQVAQHNGFTLSTIDGGVHEFDATGKLISVSDRNGNTTVLTYDTSGFLSAITNPFGSVLDVRTDSNGLVTRISDTLGVVASYEYGGSNELTSVTYADGSEFNFSYDGSLQLTTVTDAPGNILEAHTYDGQGRAITSEKDGGIEHYALNFVNNTETDVTDALGRVTKYTIDKTRGRNLVIRVEGVCSCGGGGAQVQTSSYDDQLNLTSKTDALGHTTSYTYDSDGNVLTEIDPTGTVTYTYNQFSEVLTRTNQLNDVTTYTYDSSGNPLTTTDALSNTTTFSHDSRGQLLTTTDARGKITTFTYDSNGNQIEREDANHTSTLFFWDERNRLIKNSDGLSHDTLYAYDAAGRVNQITNPDNTVVSCTYDLAGRRETVTDELGNTTTYVYDNNYRVISVTDPLNQVISYGYDDMSNLTSITDALGRVTDREYDDFNRLVKIIYPRATVNATRLFETMAYDTVGNLTSRTDTAGRVTTQTYDNADRSASMTDADSKTTSFEFDSISRLIRVVDALNQEYEFTYDAVGRKTAITRAGVSMSFVYDAVGNRTARTDYNGVTTEYSYDDLNRLTTISYPDSTSATYAYDVLSRLTSAENENATVIFSYDNRGRVLETTDVWGKTVGYSYDANGNRVAMSLDASNYANYTFDDLSRPTQLSDSSNVVADYSYDAMSKLTSRSLHNGVASTYTYDDLNRLTHMNDSVGITAILDNQYSYNTASQIVEKVDVSSNTDSYEYDPLDRLTSSSSGSFTYDAVGNRQEYSYDPFNRLTNLDSLSFSYDDNGNQLTKHFQGSGSDYSYDFENRLTQTTMRGMLQIHPPPPTTVNYKYDALGRRIERVFYRPHSVEQVQRYVYDGQDVIEDLDENNQVVTSYFNGPGIDNKLRQTDATNGNLYFTTDHLGSTTALTDDNGQVVENIPYDAFGNNDGSLFTRYTYTGREFDTDAGIYYYRARWYDPQLGRFTSEDPIGLIGGINQYAYVGNDPLGYSDPFGLQRLAPLGPRPTGPEGISREELNKKMTPTGSNSLPDDVMKNLDRGCVGMCSAYQGYHAGDPEFVKGTQCFLEERLARARRCPRCCRNFVFAKQGEWNENFPGAGRLHSTSTPYPGTPDRDGQVSTASISDNHQFNYVVYFASTHSYAFMNYGNGTPEGRIYQRAYITKQPPRTNSGYPHEIWCSTCRPKRR